MMLGKLQLEAAIAALKRSIKNLTRAIDAMEKIEGQPFYNPKTLRVWQKRLALWQGELNWLEERLDEAS